MAYLIGANLSGAILTGTILRNACLDGANFERATVSHTIFASVDLSSCTGLDSIDHVGPSTLGVDSIIHSNGRIPEAFLRGVGLPGRVDHIHPVAGRRWHSVLFLLHQLQQFGQALRYTIT